MFAPLHKVLATAVAVTTGNGFTKTVKVAGAAFKHPALLVPLTVIVTVVGVVKVGAK